MRRTALLASLALAAAAPAAAQHRGVPTPASALGFVPGTDRMLVDWAPVVAYFRALEAASDRVIVREIGRTTDGAPFIVAFISSPANLDRLRALGAIQRQLADPRIVRSRAGLDRLVRRGRVFVLITSGVHSTEVGGQFTPLELAYRLAADTSSAIRTILARTVVMLVPSLNPDGAGIVSRWYDQTLGTAAEGTSPPELYNRYAGHDDNRDWYAFTQVETQLVVDSLYDVWHPQVTLDLHQQGRDGSRIFIPPYLDPVEPNVDPLLVAGDNALGMAVAWRMTADGFTGVAVNSLYDAWSPARAFQHYHAAVRILAETASADLASPVTVPPESLRAGPGVDPRVASWNLVAPWPGGRWTLGDIVRYQTASAMDLLAQVATDRERWLRTARQVAEHAVRGWAGWPYAYVIPTAGQNPAALATLLEIFHHAQVEVRSSLGSFTIGRERFFAGTYVVVLRQPYAAFAKAMLERQAYPDLRAYPGGPPRRPYDVTAHTLPLLLGVRTLAVAESLPVALSAPVAATAPVYRAPDLSVDSASPRPGGPAVRIAVYRSYAAPADEGWTRWVLDTWKVPFASVVDSELRAGGLADRFDAIVLPSQDPAALLSGLPADRYPARFAGGLGAAGVQALRDFVDGGGTLIALNQSSDFAIGALDLPVSDVLLDLAPQDFYGPGSILRVLADPDDPLAAGMPSQTIAWFEAGPAFDVRDPQRVRVVARYPADPDDILLSGWLLGASRLAGRAAMVEVKRGRGRVILFGFQPQYRGQSLATYPLLFNAIRSARR
ncbi:MAG TPA: M14 family zinc carboxypeptidase [Gemmatimonadales bacterium]|nr:M14 family zinc carboxypeptidase [Gemmatimonadales bacterium]